LKKSAFGETSAPVAQTDVLPEFAPVSVKFGPAEHSENKAVLGWKNVRGRDSRARMLGFVSLKP
jgi:hypothetical protein